MASPAETTPVAGEPAAPDRHDVRLPWNEYLNPLAVFVNRD
jgi:hypothetical protein